MIAILAMRCFYIFILTSDFHCVFSNKIEEFIILSNMTSIVMLAVCFSFNFLQDNKS